MDKSCGNQNASTKMLAEEENLWGNLHPFDFLRNDWKSATTDRSKEHDD